MVSDFRERRERRLVDVATGDTSGAKSWRRQAQAERPGAAHIVEALR
ncbi:MAG TPA: hypothetical protein VFP84_14425 [Kofleriaceae bacterium]|nr:hypothetical protein [Kofleriaceae bacterium]